MCGVVKLNYLRNRGWWAAASARLWQRALSSPCSSLQTQKAGEIQENVYREKLGCVTYGHELGDWDSHLGACANASESCTHISASFEGESSPSFRRTRAAAAAAAAAARAAAFEREATWEEAMHELKRRPRRWTVTWGVGGGRGGWGRGRVGWGWGGGRGGGRGEGRGGGMGGGRVGGRGQKVKSHLPTNALVPREECDREHLPFSGGGGGVAPLPRRDRCCAKQPPRERGKHAEHPILKQLRFVNTSQ